MLMTDSQRTAFQEAAECRPPGRIRRLERWLLQQQALNTDVPFSAQADDSRTFVPTEEGSGSFGRWIVDDAGLPAYQYEMDQLSDPRAVYRTTAGEERRDHWHQVGNRRITALASNDGTVQVYACDRGGVIVNRYEAADTLPPVFSLRVFLYRILRAIVLFVTRSSRRIPPAFRPFSASAQTAPTSTKAPPRGVVPPDAAGRAGQASAAPDMPAGEIGATAQAQQADERHAYAGGFGYINDGAETWATAYRFRPPGAETRRLFGMGYFEHETTYRNIRVNRHVIAPYGDVPVLIADVEIENLGGSPVELAYYEYWDVNVHQLQLQWLRSGAFGPSSDTRRRDISRFFIPSVEWDEDASALRFRQQIRLPRPQNAPPPDQASEIDWDPANVFLADLDGVQAAVYVNKMTFFGKGGARKPDAVVQRRPGDTLPRDNRNDPMPYCFAIRRDITVQPGERVKMRFAYGMARPDESLDLLGAFKQPAEVLDETRAAWKDNLAYFDTGEDPVLHREMAWHAYYMLSSTVYLAFHGVHIVPQGSAYLYLHGADGAPRDQALFALPASYVDAALARDMLRLIMRVTDAETGQIMYSFNGHGAVSNGLDLHTKPSDLDLFFLLALCEYVCATGDTAFLDEAVPFYPPSQSPPGTTVLDHVHMALHHLFDVNGIGQHDLVKVGSGDWSDSIVLESALRDGPGPFGATYGNSKQDGESVPNTHMALYVLPLLAAVLKERDPGIRDRIDAGGRLARMRAGVQAQWNAKGWYNRAVLRDVHNRPVVIGELGLEAQVWPLICADEAEASRTSAVIENVDYHLDRPSPVGAALLPGGMVWPAVSQLATWGYSRTGRHHLAWRSLNRNTYAAHSTAYPNIWINTWSGPDGVNGTAADQPGWTWSSFVTPMTDFPVMNANQDAMALLGLLRVCGIEPAPDGDGLLIQPHVPRERFVLDVPLLKLEVSPTRTLVEYRAIVSGTRTLYIRFTGSDVTVRVDGETRGDVERRGDLAVIPIAFAAGQTVRIEVVSNPTPGF